MGSPLLTVAELRAVEQAAQQGLSEGELMARAGRAAARWIDTLAGATRATMCVMAGPGNNGGDGFVVARELQQRGHDVLCVLTGASEPGTADARAALAGWRAAGGRVAATPPAARFDFVIDALFGIGLGRPLQDAFAQAVDWINGCGARVVALDVPSGLDADRGAWVGNRRGVRAETTVTFIADKPGLHTGAGIDAAGDVRVESLGLAAARSGLSLVDATDFVEVTRRRGRDTHKGSFGNALVLGGGATMVGAPLLAARAALRLGAGRVYVDCIGAPELRVDPVQPELMFRPYATLTELDSIVVGCGLGIDSIARDALNWALAREASLVVDADALNLLASDDALRSALTRRTGATVLTPHPLEAGRLLGLSAQQVQADRIAAARRLAGEYRAFVVLKGAGTVLADPTGRAAINPTGSPALASAGTGDVLAGMIGALLAQQFEANAAVPAAVWLHGAAVSGLGDIGVVASDLAQRAAAALRQLREGS